MMVYKQAKKRKEDIDRKSPAFHHIDYNHQKQVSLLSQSHSLLILRMYSYPRLRPPPRPPSRPVAHH